MPLNVFAEYLQNICRVRVRIDAGCAVIGIVMHAARKHSQLALTAIVLVALALQASPGFAQLAGCAYFHKKLSDLPHLDLYVSAEAFNSIWDGRRTDGCEVVLETHTSLLPSEDGRRQFEQLLKAPGWKLNELLVADGPGSSSAALEYRNERCSLHWSQNAWVEDRTHETRDGDEIRIIVQCSEIPD